MPFAVRRKRQRTPRGGPARASRPKPHTFGVAEGGHDARFLASVDAQDFVRQSRAGVSELRRRGGAVFRPLADEARRLSPPGGAEPCGKARGSRRRFESWLHAESAGTNPQALPRSRRSQPGSLLATNLDGQLVPTLLAPRRQDLATPLCGHTSTEPVLIDPLTVARAIRGHHSFLTLRTFREFCRR